MKKYYIFKIDINLLSLFSVILLILTLFLTYLLFPVISKEMLNVFCDFNFIFIVLMVLYFMLHEVLHAIGYILNGANYKKITFGMELEKGVFYCLCKQDITKKNILISLMFPLFFIGILTYVVSLIFNMPLLMLLSILNISGASGDIMYFLFISRLDRDIMYSELDDGTSFAILSSKDLSKERAFGLKFVSVEEDIPREDFRILKISKWSYVILLFCVLISVVYFLIALLK